MRKVRTLGVTGKPWGWHHNLFFMLLGPTGSGRSTALWEIFFEVTRPIYKLAEIGSPESFLEELSEIFPEEQGTQALLIMDEANKFFRQAGNPKSYMAGVLELLTRVWDCPNKLTRRVGTRRNARLYSVYEPFVGFVGSAQTIPFVELMDENMLEQGFFTRLIPVLSDRETERDLEPLPVAELEDVHKLQRVTQIWLDSFDSMPITIVWDAETLDLLNWCMKRLRQLAKDWGVPQLGGRFFDSMVRIAGAYTFDSEILARIFDFVEINNGIVPLVSIVSNVPNVPNVPTPKSRQKSATYKDIVDTGDSGDNSDNVKFEHYSSVEGDKKLPLSKKAITRAYRFMRRRLKEVSVLYADIRSAKILKTLKRLLRRKSPRTRRDLLKNSHLLVKDFEEAIDTLLQSGEVCAYVIQDPGGDVMKYHLRNCGTCEQDPQYCPENQGNR
jgi:hypothetical protein